MRRAACTRAVSVRTTIPSRTGNVQVVWRPAIPSTSATQTRHSPACPTLGW